MVKIRISAAIFVLTAAASVTHGQTPVDFSYTMFDATTGSGTVTANVDTTPVGGPGVLAFTGSVPLPSINQKDATAEPIPAGMIGFMTANAEPNPGTPNGVHLGWTGSVTMSAADGNFIYEIDVPLTIPVAGTKPISYTATVTDDNSSVGGTNDITSTNVQFALWVGDDGGGHRQTQGGDMDFSAGIDTFMPSSSPNLGGNGNGDALGFSASLRDAINGTLFLDEVSFSIGNLQAVDSSLQAIAIPEPATVTIWLLLGGTLAGFVVFLRRRKQAS